MAGKRRRKDRAFGFLLRMFPSEFRDDFGDDMRTTFREDRSDARRGGGRGGPVRFWIRTVLGMLRSAPREHLDALRIDVRYALRMMRRRPLFTATAAASLAIGIGATATVVAVFSAAFLRPIPGVESSDRRVNGKVTSQHEESFDFLSYPNYQELRAGGGALADLAGFNGTSLSLGLHPGAEPEQIAAQVVTASYFRVLGMQPRIGRFFDAREDEEGAQQVAVLSSWIWVDRFGSDPSVLGREIWLNGTRFTVVGVAPEGFRGHFVGFNFDLFVPPSAASIAGLPGLMDREGRWVEMIGLLADDVSLEQAGAALALSSERLEAAHPEVNRGLGLVVERDTGHDAELRGGLLVFLIALTAVSGFVLLIACVNVANMQLAHVIARRGEMAVRLALGAPRGRLVRQLVTENILLALLACGMGSLLAWWATGLTRRAFVAFEGRISLGVHLDPATLAIAVAISFGAALLFGVAPAMRASRADVASVLKGSGRQVGSRSRIWRGLVVAQVVLSLVVLICAGLFVRVLRHATAIDPGFDVQGVYVAGINPALMGMDPEASPELLARILDRVREQSGAEEVALVSRVPLSLGARFFPSPLAVRVPGWEPPPEQDAFLIEHAVVSDGYFQVLRIPLVQGRAFEPADRQGSRRVAVVNEAFARRFFPSGTALGQTLHEGDDEMTIVGIARDSKYRRLDEEPMPHLYMPFRQSDRRSGALLARSGPRAAGFADALRETVRAEAAHLPIRAFVPLDRQLAVGLLPQKIAAGVAGVLGVIGLLLTAVGLHGVVAYSAARRSSEIGLRMSLGARPADILRMMLRQGLVLAGIGIAIGVPLAAASARLLGTFLVGVSPMDPATYVGISAVLMAASLLACYLPALRASRVDPATVLRDS